MNDHMTNSIVTVDDKLKIHGGEYDGFEVNSVIFDPEDNTLNIGLNKNKLTGSYPDVIRNQTHTTISVKAHVILESILS